MKKLDLQTLNKFTGTTQYRRIGPRHLLTDGTHYLAEQAGCYSLMGEIAQPPTHEAYQRLLTGFSAACQSWSFHIDQDQELSEKWLGKRLQTSLHAEDQTTKLPMSAFPLR